MKKNERNKNKKTRNKFGVFFAFTPIVLIAILIVQLLKLNAIPFKLLIPIIAVFVLLGTLIYVTQSEKRKSKFVKNGGRFISALLSLVLIIGNIYVYRTGSFLNLISGGDEMIDTVSVVVLKDNPAESIEDVIDGYFGIEDDRDPVVTETIEYINKENSSDIMISEFNSYGGLANYLYEGKVNAIIINEAYRDFIKEKYPDFDDETKVIFTHKIKRVMEQSASKTKVTKEGFNVLITGIDVYGSINNNSRSDVNIIATVNPKTKSILLTAVPRDYYLPMPCQGGARDKLTHSGIFGVDCTMQTLANAFNVDIEHYARVNFSSFVQVIDTLGGVTVTVDEPFSANGYSFPAGPNDMNGEKALVFVRDRYHQSGGDRDRGKNQMKVIAAVIDKAVSPAIVTNYMGILNSLEGSFQTSLSSKQITSLVQMQLNDMSGWNVYQQRVDGNGVSDYSPALGFNAYVMYPDENDVNYAKEQIIEILGDN